MTDLPPRGPSAETAPAAEPRQDDGEAPPSPSQPQEETVRQDEPVRQEEPAVPEVPPPAAPSAAESDEAAPIPPDSLRLDPRAVREIFGALYAGATAYGPSQFGDNNTMHNYFGKRPLDPIIGKLPDIEKLMALYVPAGGDEELDDKLSKRSAVCLVGPRNSGRYSTARAALARRYEPDRVYEIALPSKVLPEALSDKPERLPENSGFVLRLAGDGHVDAMRKLAPVFRKRLSSLLLIKDEEQRRRDLQGAEVGHRAPDPVKVFRSHVAASLPGEDADPSGQYLTDEVVAALGASYGPKESVAIADAIAKEHPADERALGAILGRSQPRRRQRAAAILLPEGEGSAARSRRAGQHERAFRLSYAVFCRRPMHYVFQAADWLLREIDSAALRPEWGRMALQHPVHELLGDTLKQDWVAGREAGNAALGASRVAWIRDPGLRGAIIDVAWHDFDGTRGPLLTWLDHLVEEGDDVMRRAAAETAGLLVHYDFARVHQDLVDRWAGSRLAAVRQAAAWTMTLSDMAGDAGPRVRAKLSAWCSGSSNHQRDTAARVYASGLEQPVLAWSMFDLAQIASNPMQKRRHVVAEAINQLYRPERAAWILRELQLWARASRLLQLHAARAVLALVARVEANALDGRPDLLGRLADRQVDAGVLGLVWLGAFLEPETESAAADALARWIRHADVNADYRDDVVALVDAIGAVPVMRRRVIFYLKRTSEFRNGLPPWMREERRIP